MYSKIIGTGSYLPGEPIDNSLLSNLFDIDEWILENIGISKRYWSMNYRTGTLSKTGHEMATEAAKKAILDSGIDKNDIDTIFLVTAAPDYIMPNSAVLVQEDLDIKECSTFEIHAACSGAIQALELADSSIKSGKSNNILICCFNLMSPFMYRELDDSRKDLVDTRDLLNLSMFGDGASAVVIGKSNTLGMEYIKNNSVGVGKKAGMELLAGSAVYPFVDGIGSTGLDKWKHDAHAIKKYGGGMSKRALDEFLDTSKMNINDIDYIIFPQANPVQLVEDIDKLSTMFDMSKNHFRYNVNEIGNVSTPGLFMVLDDLNNEKLLKTGSRVLIVGGEASKWMYGYSSIVW